MSTVRSRVKRALSDEQTSSEPSDGGSQSTSKSHSMTEDELTQAVKEGLNEALDERSMIQQEGETSEAGETEDEGGSSARGRMMRLLVLGALVAIGMLARRRLQTGGSEESTDYQEPGE